MSLKTLFYLIRKKFHNDLTEFADIDHKTLFSFLYNEAHKDSSWGKSSWQAEYFKKIHEYIPLMEFEGMRLARLGGQNVGINGDGGYVMNLPLSSSKIAYSFGINKDCSWDSRIADIGYDVFMYDHTISSLPYNRKEFHWEKTGLCGKDKTENCLTLEELIRKNRHEGNSGMLLKIDIEGAEWDVFDSIESGTLDKFDQIAVEFHGMNNFAIKEKILSSLNKISETHCCIHLHGNNYSDVFFCGKYVMPNCVEATFVRKKSVSGWKTSSETLPREIDVPCNLARCEIILGEWNL